MWSTWLTAIRPSRVYFYSTHCLSYIHDGVLVAAFKKTQMFPWGMSRKGRETRECARGCLSLKYRENHRQMKRGDMQIFSFLPLAHGRRLQVFTLHLFTTQTLPWFQLQYIYSMGRHLTAVVGTHRPPLPATDYIQEQLSQMSSGMNLLAPLWS